jgi:hypothetical protein
MSLQVAASIAALCRPSWEVTVHWPPAVHRLPIWKPGFILQISTPELPLLRSTSLEEAQELRKTMAELGEPKPLCVTEICWLTFAPAARSSSTRGLDARSGLRSTEQGECSGLLALPGHTLSHPASRSPRPGAGASFRPGFRLGPPVYGRAHRLPAPL